MDIKRFAVQLGDQFEEAMDGTCEDEGAPAHPDFQLDYIAFDSTTAFVQVSHKKTGAETAVVWTKSNVFLDFAPEPVLATDGSIDRLSEPYVPSSRTQPLKMSTKKDEIVKATFANAARKR